MTFSKIFLVGLPGSGKTTLGKKLANQLNLPFVDLDEEIVLTENQPITSIFEHKGEASFRKIELDHLRSIISANDCFVLATGGGTPCFHDNMKLMNTEGFTIYLNTPLEEIEERLKNDSTRPLLKKYNLPELLESRRKWYEQAQKSISNSSDVEALLE